ncbi:hypothetical protein FXO38_34054 [Capsicum annuum]|nr:hypothetical protein FXO38_34054 [Capsicum annuum]
MEIHFPEETIVEILIRLSVQSLPRFKCASKSWKTLILRPYFKSKHCNNHAKNNKKLLIARMNPETQPVSGWDMTRLAMTIRFLRLKIAMVTGGPIKSCASWREIDNYPPGFRDTTYGDLAFHWICMDDLLKSFVISFNISNEVYGEIYHCLRKFALLFRLMAM